MKQLCRKFAISTIATLALAGACLTASTQVIKANEYDDFEIEFLTAPKKTGYKELLEFLKAQGVDEFYADFYLAVSPNKDFVKKLEEFKSQTKDDIKNEVISEVDNFFEMYAPAPIPVVEK
ncbi:hypothetical protein ACVRW4_04350 [Streptococcus phocae subsp. phocae]|uniref:Uncharacterized protein n=1 Tax=Streptococcus phocae TaxID=119224 RepID=A0A0P6S1M0_9STRE|nr:hypothetical protein [Streptococcus phocae]KPJ22376.1 hypothetical protein AKK44_05015 [Streptococcus phocae]